MQLGRKPATKKTSQKSNEKHGERLIVPASQVGPWSEEGQNFGQHVP